MAFLSWHAISSFVSFHFNIVPPYEADLKIDDPSDSQSQDSDVPEGGEDVYQSQKAATATTISTEDGVSGNVPSVASLVREFRSRPWSDDIRITYAGTQTVVSGFLAGTTPEERVSAQEADRKRLLHVVHAYLHQFSEHERLQGAKDVGLAERLNVENSSWLYTLADRHGHLSSVLADLDFLVQEGFMDPSYRCNPGFRLAFLGDNTDRGVNEIELMTLQLCLRMQNPDSVFMLRGNHEIVAVQQEYSQDGKWFKAHEELFSRCYSTFPLATCIGEKTGGPDGIQEYMHMSHGGVSLDMDLAPLLEGSKRLMAISDCPAKAIRLSTTVAKKGKKQRTAYSRISHLGEVFRDANAYVCQDVGDNSGSSPLHKGGSQLSVPDIHDYMRAAGGKRRKVKYFLRGHSHAFEEYQVQSPTFATMKVIGSTLPAALPLSPSNPIEGVLYRIAPKMRNWTKRATMLQGKGSEASVTYRGHAIPMYQRF
jgi:hypothetical protein